MKQACQLDTETDSSLGEQDSVLLFGECSLIQ